MNGARKISKGIFCLYLLSLLFAACASADTGINVPTEVVTEQPTLIPTEIPTSTEIPAPEYPLVPDFENFEDCYVPVEELLNGDYWNWLNDVIAPTLLPWFQEHEDKIKYIKPIVVGIPYAGSTFVFSRPGKIEYEDPETRPWKRDVTFAFTSMKIENGKKTLEYLVLPFFYYDKVTQQVYPIVSVVPIYNENPDYSVGKRQFLEVMNIPAIVYSQSTGQFNKDNIEMNDSIVGQSYANLGKAEVWRRIQEFYDHGDMSVFSDPRIVVLSQISSTDAFK